MIPNIMVDRISVLPHDIIDSILTRLEIKEAARTCILSRSWRYQWHFLSKLNIDFTDFDNVLEAEFVTIIDHILHVHRGSVDKLELSFDFEACNANDIIDRWILYGSRNGVKELGVNNWDVEQDYSISSCLFQCSDLTYLQLTRCMVKVKPPAAFKEFGNLTKLSFDRVTIDSKVLENAITSCPLLNQLSLEEVELEPPLSLNINAPKLVLFRVFGLDHFPRFLNTPLLDSAYFGWLQLAPSLEKDWLIEFLQSTPVLQKLELDRDALQHLAVGDVPACLPSVCLIRQLTLSIRFENLRELQTAFCIFRSSPFIQHLKIRILLNTGRSRVSSDGFWKGEHDFSFKLGHLQTVKVPLFMGTESELKFIKFILSNAPALKTMSIRYFRGFAERASVVRKLVRFPRISPNAELVLPANWNR